MKLSIAWLFDYIDVDWKQYDITIFVSQFNETIAEIEDIQKIELNFNQYTLAQIVDITTDGIIAHSSELKKDIMLPLRNDVQKDHLYLLQKKDKEYIWAPIEDFCVSRQGLLPAFSIEASLLKGEWKKKFEKTDYILDIDNKSITHRPDLWGHYGMAREIAAMLEVPLRPIDNFIVDKKVAEHKKSATSTADDPFSITIETKACDRFATLYFEQITHTPSPLWMALRLMRIGARPIDALVDITNYVMFDVGQPLHAFDADKITTNKIVVRNAKNKEKLLLFKNQEITLTSDDVVVTDGKEPLALAGIRGGKKSGVTIQTKRLLLESAHFDATTIRRTSARIKLRTEASARFEKSLDPNQNITGIERFLKLLDDEYIVYKAADAIQAIGAQAQPYTIVVTQRFIESRLGCKIAPGFIIKTLEDLGFDVQNADGRYAISVPTFRATKDILIPEDVVEEIGRFYGYSTIEKKLPSRQMAPFPLNKVQRRRAIKELLAFGCGLREVSNYAFYDENFLRYLNWEPTHTVIVANPQSENWQQLVTSLIPGLLKNVVENKSAAEQLRFFEWSRTWYLSDNKVDEQHILAGIIFDQKKSVDFYTSKTILTDLFTMLAMPVIYEQYKPREVYNNELWWHPYQTARIMHSGKEIGIAGKLNPLFFNVVLEGDAFGFQLNAQLLQEYHAPTVTYKPASKYPAVHRDISMFISSEQTVRIVAQQIEKADEHIHDVTLIDRFEKDEWEDKKSLTFSYVISDPTKTLTSEDVETIIKKVMHNLEQLGATIR